jgi:hypothetical protein
MEAPSLHDERSRLGVRAKKVVSSTKFDPAAGMRPMPRLTVEL